jgi:hypothetical protein
MRNRTAASHLPLILCSIILFSAQKASGTEGTRCCDGTSNAQNQSAPTTPSGNHQATAEEQDYEANRQHVNVQNRESGGLGVSELIAFVAVLAYFIQAAVMRQTLVYASRAYVHLKQFGQPEPVRIGHQAGSIVAWRFSPNWENSGNTPTVDMKIG